MMTENELKEIILRYDKNLKTSGFERAKSGFNNPVYITHFANKSDIVLKTITSEKNDWKIVKEETIFHLLSQNGVPVPEILLSDTTKSIVPFAYLLESKLTGKSLSSAKRSFSRSDLLSIYSDLGELLAKIHSISFDKFGDVKTQNKSFVAGNVHELGTYDNAPYDKWGDMFIDIIKNRLAGLKDSELNTYTDTVLSYFLENINLVDYEITPRLLHLDLHGGNIFIDDNKITGIIDVEESLIGHNEYDIMRTELGNFEESEDEFRNCFFNSYKRIIPFDQGYIDRRNFYKLSRLLVQAKCLIEFGEKYSDDLRNDMQKVKSDIDKIIMERPTSSISAGSIPMRL